MELSRISGIESLVWDTQDVVAEINPLGISGSTPAEDPHAAATAGPMPGSANSQGSTPEATQVTVVHVSPAQVENTASAAPPPVESSQPPAPTGECVVAVGTVGPEAERSGDLADFEDFLDTAAAEIKLLSGVGHRSIDIILRSGFEYRRDRHTEKTKLSQLWVCRYANKFKCKGKLRITTRCLDTFPLGAEVLQLKEHSHPPHRVNTYGWGSVTEVHTSDASTDDNTHSTSSAHAISQIDEGEFSADFDEEIITSKRKSSPATSATRSPSSIDRDLSAARSPSLDLSWDLEAVSQEDINPYLRLAHVSQGKGQRNSVAPASPAHSSAKAAPDIQ